MGEACLPSNAYYPRTHDYTLYSGVHVCWSEHSDSSLVYGFMSLDYGLGNMAATTLISWMFFFDVECHMTIPLYIMDLIRVVYIWRNNLLFINLNERFMRQVSLLLLFTTFNTCLLNFNDFSNKIPKSLSSFADGISMMSMSWSLIWYVCSKLTYPYWMALHLRIEIYSNHKSLQS